MLAAAAATAVATVTGLPHPPPAGAAPSVRTEDPTYKAATTKRYLPKGRPASGEEPPAFDPDLPTFKPASTPAGVVVGDGGGDASSSIQAASSPTVGASIELQDAVVPPPSGAGAPPPPVVYRGALVVAHYRAALSDGTVIEDTRAAGAPAFFRAASGQVMAGVDAGVIGMVPGGVRRIRGVAADMFSDITSGERSVVPASETVYVTLEVLRVNPYGPGV